LYKPPYFHRLSLHINTLLASITQMNGKQLWFKNLATVQTMLEEYGQ
jgi:hypothetical protein